MSSLSPSSPPPIYVQPSSHNNLHPSPSTENLVSKWKSYGQAKAEVSSANSHIKEIKQSHFEVQKSKLYEDRGLGRGPLPPDRIQMMP